MKKKLAIIGGGIAGLTLAYKLQSLYDITLYEKETRLGGHARTLTLDTGETLDLYVINFNKAGYREFFKLMDDIGYDNFCSSLSLASFLSYEKGQITASVAMAPKLLWHRKRELALPGRGSSLYHLSRIGVLFNLMMKDYRRGLFSSEHVQELYRFYPAFSLEIRNWLIPLVSLDTFNIKKLRIVDALSVLYKKNTSSPISLLTQNRTARNGVQEYIEALASKISATILLDTPIDVVKRKGKKLEVVSSIGIKTFDKAAFAIPSFAIPEILELKNNTEKNIFKQAADLVSIQLSTMHTDTSIFQGIPERLWGYGNVLYDRPADEAQKTIYMNRAKPLGATPYLHTIQSFDHEHRLETDGWANSDEFPTELHRFDKTKILHQQTQRHVLIGNQAEQMATAVMQFSGTDNLYFCGGTLETEYIGNHEGAVRSALALVNRLQTEL